MAGQREVGVIGAGGEGLALAAHLAEQGYRVHLHSRRDRELAGIADNRAIRVSGAREGSVPLAGLTGELRELTENCGYLFVATVTTAYPAVADALAEFLDDRHTVVLFSSKLGGSAEFATRLAERGGHVPDVVETDALFAARPDGDDGVRLLGRKRWNLISGSSRAALNRHSPWLRELFDGLEPAVNLVHRGLTDFGAIAHSSIALVNLGTIERGDDLLFYHEGIGKRTIAIVEALEEEFRATAEQYEAKLLSMTEVLDRYYGCRDDDLLTAIRTVEPYRYVHAPTSLQHRFLHEDVASTLVPMQYLAELAGLRTPIADAIVNLSATLNGTNPRSGGRTLARLGWAGLSHEELLCALRN